MRKGPKGIRLMAGIFLMLLGAGFFFYPEAAAVVQKWQAERYVEAFEEQKTENESITSMADYGEGADEGSVSAGGENVREAQDKEQARLQDPLYQQMLSYNENLAVTGQKNFTDAWIITQVPEEIAAFDLDSVGYIRIPAMDVTLPLYIGATTENMAKGAAILGQTSMPIGGENTNCVIAGHRGYCGAPYFREIENLKTGDLVYITNRWEELTYRVCSICVIDPCDTEKMLIQEGKDMVTLITCHPYRSHGKYRYVVYCERVPDLSGAEDKEAAEELDAESLTETEEPDETILSETEEYVSSKQDIKREKEFRAGCFLFLMILFVLTLTINRKE